MMKQLYCFIVLFVLLLHASHVEAKTGKCGNSVYYDYDETTLALRVYGSGPMASYSYSSDTPFYYFNPVNITIESGVTSIGSYAFYGTNAPLVIIGETVTSIGTSAFEGADTTTLIILSSLSSVDYEAFDRVYPLDVYYYGTKSPSCGTWAFEDYSSVHVYTTSSYSQTKFCSLSVSRTLPGGSCGANLKWYYSNPVGLLKIYGYGNMTDFENASQVPWSRYSENVTSVSMDGKVTSIGSYAFSGLSSLSSVTMASSITSIGDSAFSSCIALTNVVLPDDLESVGASAFSGCTGLTLVFISDEVKTIGSSAFKSCSELTSVRYYGDNAITSPTDVFDDCAQLTSIRVADTYPATTFCGIQVLDRVTVKGTCGFDLQWEYNDAYGILTITGSGSMTEFDSADAVPWKQWKPNVTAINIGEEVTSVGAYAFSSCDNVNSIRLPHNTSSIGDYAFSSCSSLHSVTYTGFSSITSPSNAFDGCDNLANISVSKLYTNDYFCGKPVSRTFLSGKCGVHVNWLFENSTNSLIIEGRGPMANYSNSYYSHGDYITTAPWRSILDYIENVVIYDGVTTIGDYAFYNANSIISLTFPSSLTKVGSYAFYQCSSLSSIPSSVTYVGSYAFSYCTGLTSISLPLSYIGAYAFYECDSLTSVTLLSSLSYIGSSAFSSYTISSLEYFGASSPSCGSSCFYRISSLSVSAAYIYDSFCGYSAPKRTLQGGACGDNLRWIYHNRTESLYVQGIGKMTNFESADEVPWKNFSSSITSVKIEGKVTSIGNYAFSNCVNMKSVTIPSSVTSIGDSAFSSCVKLMSITLPTDLESIGASAFSGCADLRSVFIPDNIKSIGSSAFKSCSKLASAKYHGSSAMTSPTNVFDECTQLNSVQVSNSYSATTFYGKQVTALFPSGTCGSKLQWIFDVTNDVLSIMGSGSMTQFGSADDVPWKQYKTTLTSVEIGEGVTSIGAYAFSSCNRLKSVRLPPSITSIGDSAFESCPLLFSVVISYHVTSIGQRAFSFCPDLEYVDVLQPGAVTAPTDVFENCTKLSSVYVPSIFPSSSFGNKSVVSRFASGSCGSSVTYVIDIDSRVLLIFGNGNATSSGWSSNSTQFDDVYIEDGVTSIPASGFSELKQLPWIVIPDSVTSIGSSAFNSCTCLQFIQFSRNLLSIGDEVFRGCSALQLALIPSATSIGDYSFAGCTSLSRVSLPNNLETIGMSAFQECPSLLSIDIPASVTSIGKSAFKWCSSLESINVATDNPRYMDSDGILFNKKVTVLVRFPQNKQLSKYVIPQSVTKIDFEAFHLCQLLGSVELSNNLVTIGEYAFYGCTAIDSILMPDTVTSVGKFAFSHCSNISSLNISGGLVTIEEQAFSFCSKIPSADIPNPVLTIQSKAFYSCSALYQVSFPKFLLSIDSSAFEGCSSLRSASFYSSLVSIGYRAFYGCSSLNSVSIPTQSSLKNIGSYAFNSCSNLASISIPESVDSIGKYAFYSSRSLTHVDLPSALVEIGDYAFYGSGLISLVIPYPVSIIGSYAFSSCSSLTSVRYLGISVIVENTTFSNLDKVTVAETYPSNEFCGIPVDHALPSGVCGDFLRWVFDNKDNVLYIEGKGDMQDFASADDIPWKQYKSSIRSVKIGSEVTSISENAFSDCVLMNSVDIPASVSLILDSAFAGCSDLVYVMYYGLVDPGSSSKKVFDGCGAELAVHVPHNYRSSQFCGVVVDPSPSPEPPPPPPPMPSPSSSSSWKPVPTSSSSSAKPVPTSSSSSAKPHSSQQWVSSSFVAVPSASLMMLLAVVFARMF